MTTSPVAFHPVKSTIVRTITSTLSPRPFLRRAGRGVVRALCHAAPRQAAAWAERLFLTTRRRPRPEWERQLLAGAETFAFESAGRQLAGYGWRRGGELGDAPLVILAHGWEGRGSQLAAFADPLMTAGYQVAAFDAPGHGDAEGRRSSLVEMGWAIRDLAAHLGRAPAAVIAHSAGTTAATWAVRRGLPVERLIYLAPPADLVRTTWQWGWSAGLTSEVMERVQGRVEARLGVSWQELRSVLEAPRMELPLLVVHDRADGEVPLADAQELADAWPGSRLRITEGLGHRRILRSPEVLAEVLAFTAAGRQP